MSIRKIGGIIFGVATLIVIGFTIYKLTAGEKVGFNEIISISLFLMMYFSTITWGTKESKDGIMQEEELMKKVRLLAITFFLCSFFSPWLSING